MMKLIVHWLVLAGVTLSPLTAQEYYADPYVGLPEFRILPLRMATDHPDSIRIEVHVRIVYDDLQFVKKNDHYEAAYSLDLILEKGKEERVSTSHLERQISVSDYAQTNSRLLNDHSISDFVQTPDHFKLRVTLTDKESRKERNLEKGISFPEKEWGPNLRLSDLAPLDSAGVVQMTLGIMSGQPLRAAFNLFHSASDPPQIEYQVQNEKDEITATGKFTLTPGQQFYADTLVIPASTFTGSASRVVVKAASQGVELARAFTLKTISENLPDYIQNVDLAIRQLKYIAEPLEIQRMISAPLWKREDLFLDFWKKRDPNPATINNEKMDEYYRRITYSNHQFKGLREGWETDMGRVYVIFGQPTDVERHPFDIDKKPYEVWHYDDLNRRFLFVDDDGFGDYRLRTPLLSDH
jgi:GWxTD domain-containing protein